MKHQAARVSVIPNADTEFRARGYWHDNRVWVAVDVDDTLGIQTADDIESMQRFADALLTAVAEARAAEAEHRPADSVGP